jgi:hypothetical protein
LEHLVTVSNYRTGDHATHCDLAGFDGCDWAWEFLRLNKDYVADWRCAVPRRLPCIDLIDGTRMMRLPRRSPRAERWGLHAFANPTLCAHEVPVFWHPNALRRVIRIHARKPAPGDDARVCRLADFKADRRAVIGVDGIPRVLIKGRGLHVPLEIHGLSVLTAPFVPVFELHDLADLAGHTELLRRLQRFTEPGDTATQGQPTMCEERLHHALIALDESLKGRTYRQIAIIIFGEKQVAEEWQGSSQFLKDRTRRLVAKGNELMNGGYRDLLG